MSVNYMTGEAYPNLDDDISSYMLFESIKNHLKLKNLSAEDYQERIKKIADALDIL